MTIECEKCKDILKNKDLYIMNLQLQLQFERMKNNIFTDIIQKHTDIKIDNVIKEKTDEIHIFNFDQGNIPIVLHEFDKENTEKFIIEKYKPKFKPKKKSKLAKTRETPILVIESDNDEKLEIKPEKPKKKIYRSVKEYTKTSEKVLESKLQEDVVRVDKEIEEIVYNNFDVSYKDITEQLEKLFNNILNTRIYTVSLFSIKKLRHKLLGKLSLNEYTKIILQHIKRLETIFEKRNFNNKKIQKIIASSLTPLDMRLSYYSGYTNANIEPDDVQQFGLALDILVKHKKQFVPYEKTTFIDHIKNYSLSLFEISECIERCLVNKYGYHNIIYIPRPKSTSKDPYSFYILIKAGDVRQWEMACRLEDFSTYIADVALSYCIPLFRRIYKDVFNDNIYRDDYMGKSQIMEFDCEQLIQNIITLSRPKTFCQLLQEIIMTKCKITPTEADKFDLYADDKLQQKKFASMKNSDEDMCTIMKRLFDGISDENAMNIINSR